MKVEFTRGFIKIYKKRFGTDADFRRKFENRTRMFSENPKHPLLRDHGLIGEKVGLRAFSITGDIRIVYYIYDEVAYFDDIGSHNQVY